VQLTLPEPALRELPSGLTLVTLRDETSNLVTVRWRSRLALEDSVPMGLPRLLASLLTEGTRAHPGQSFVAAVEALGTTLESDADGDALELALTVLPEDLPAALALLAEAVTSPQWEPSTFRRVAAETFAQRDAELQDPAVLAQEILVRQLGGPVLGAPPGGTHASLTAITLARVRQVHRAALVARRSALIVVGRFEDSTLTTAVETRFAELPRGVRLTESPLPEPPAAPGLALVARPGAVQAALTFGRRLPNRQEPRYAQRELLIGIAGGLFTSRLNTSLREEHAWTYGVFARQSPSRRWNALVGAASVETAHAVEAWQETQRVLRDLSTVAPPSTEELRRAQADLRGRLGAALGDVERLSERVARVYSEGLPPGWFGTLLTQAEQTPLPALLELGPELSPENLSAVMVGDATVLEPVLAQRGVPYRLISDPFGQSPPASAASPSPH